MRAKASESLTSVTGLGRKQKKPRPWWQGRFSRSPAQPHGCSRGSHYKHPALAIRALRSHSEFPLFFWKQYKLCCSTSGLETNSLSVNISRGRLGNKKEGWGLRCINRQRTSPAFLRGLSGSDHSVAMKPRTGTAVVLPLVLEIQQLSSLGYAILYL